MLAIAVVARVITWFAYGSSLLYPDSVDYLQQSQVLHPEAWHPLGYPVFVEIGLRADVLPASSHAYFLSSSYSPANHRS